MKKIMLVLSLLAVCVVQAAAQVNIRNEAAIFYSRGFAGEDQLLPDTFLGGYDETRNGHYINGQIKMSGDFQNRYDYFLQLNTSSRTGAPYVDLLLGSVGPTSFAIDLDSIWARFHLGRMFLPDLNIGGAEMRIFAKMGKYSVPAFDLGISRFGLESVQGMVKMNNSPALSVETVASFPGPTQVFRGTRSSLTLELATGGLFDEAIQRLYDGDGGISNHGKPVVGEFAHQLFARIALNEYMLSYGRVSAGAAYAYNAGGIYSGHSAGAALRLTLDAVPGALAMPMGLSLAYHEKNIDALAAYSGTEQGKDSTSFRQTLRVGTAIGIQLLKGTLGLVADPKPVGDLALSGSWSRIGHYYRDPINVFDLGIDGQYSIQNNLYIGGGFTLGTLTEFSWQTSEGVGSAQDDFHRTYRLADNYGYELYLGVDVVPGVRMSVGFAHLKGLSMNRGLESIQTGMVKLRQPGTSVSDMLWETKAAYVLTNIRL